MSQIDLCRRLVAGKVPSEYVQWVVNGDPGHLPFEVVAYVIPRPVHLRSLTQRTNEITDAVIECLLGSEVLSEDMRNWRQTIEEIFGTEFYEAWCRQVEIEGLPRCLLAVMRRINTGKLVARLYNSPFENPENTLEYLQDHPRIILEPSAKT